MIKDVKDNLVKLGAISASMSGSGPSVFGIAKDEADAQRICKEMKKVFSRSYAASNVNLGVKIIS